MSDSGFKARDIGLRAQKKLLSRMSNKTVAKVFIDDTTGQLLDNLHRLVKTLAGRKEADKVIKNIIKMVIKIGILYRNDQFDRDELALAESFKKKFHSTAMTVISFFEVDFSFDKIFLSSSLDECRLMLKQLVQRHLTDKSLGRIDHVFRFFTDNAFLDNAFRKESSAQRTVMTNIVQDMHKLMEEGGL